MQVKLHVYSLRLIYLAFVTSDAIYMYLSMLTRSVKYDSLFSIRCFRVL